MENLLSSQATQGTKLRDRLKLGQPNLSYADLHAEVINNIDNIPPTSSGNHQKQQVERKAIENEELVKYMSNLPSYLERGENLQEKAFNVGVLDWRRLEKWRYNQKQVPCRGSSYSSSSSNTSSFSSTDGSSTLSSSGHSCSPARQRMPRPTLQCHSSASPTEVYSQGVKPFVENVGKFEDLKAASSDPLKGQQTILRTHQSFKKSHSEIKLKECKKKDSIPLTVTEIKTSLDLENYGVASCSKGKMKIQGGESTKGVEKLQEPYRNIIDHDLPERCKTVVLLLPKDDTENNHFAISRPSDLTAINGQRSSEVNRRSFSEVSFSKEVDCAELYSDIPRSYLLPCEVGNKHTHIKRPSSISEKRVKFLSEPSQALPSSAKTSTSPPRGKNLQEKSTTMPANSTLIKSSNGSDLKTGTGCSS
ncbi:hypothetical protein F0562_001024 [Nyssa sinensis]|uniref:Uncharacterized protein n=1 Tax=Nyssa sinensis TaxID=561372 RepID=A0A5J5C5T5_9ASTE|nr:hypothetical protein F0562_001024 [Nyssa sinensis]